MAILHFSHGPSSWLRQAALGPCRLVADVYIPFDVFRVETKNKSNHERILLAIDAVTGELDPYRLDEGFIDGIVSFRTRNAIQASVSQIQLSNLAMDHARRMIFNRGFFRVSELQMTTTRLSESLHFPYWVGFHAAGSMARLSVINAISGRAEGAKLRGLLSDWLCPDSNVSTPKIVPQTP